MSILWEKELIEGRRPEIRSFSHRMDSLRPFANTPTLNTILFLGKIIGYRIDSRITQSKFEETYDAQNTDGILRDFLDLEQKILKINLCKLRPDGGLVSDFSHEELINASQDIKKVKRVLKPLNWEDLCEI